MSDKPDLFTAPLPSCCQAPAHSVNHMGKAATCLRCNALFSWIEGSWQKLAAPPVPADVAPPVESTVE